MGLAIPAELREVRLRRLFAAAAVAVLVAEAGPVRAAGSKPVTFDALCALATTPATRSTAKTAPTAGSTGS
jgi:hypothetical protein